MSYNFMGTLAKHSYNVFLLFRTRRKQVCVFYIKPRGHYVTFRVPTWSNVLSLCEFAGFTTQHTV